MVFDALGLAGQLLANSMGLSFAFNVDPMRGASTPAVGQFYMLLVTLTFLALERPPGADRDAGGRLRHAAGRRRRPRSGWRLWIVLVLWSGQLFDGAVAVALPGMTALLVVNLAFGVMSRAAPTLNLFAVGFPVTLVFGLVVMLLLRCRPCRPDFLRPDRRGVRRLWQRCCARAARMAEHAPDRPRTNVPNASAHRSAWRRRASAARCRARRSWARPRCCWRLRRRCPGGAVGAWLRRCASGLATHARPARPMKPPQSLSPLPRPDHAGAGPRARHRGPGGAGGTRDDRWAGTSAPKRSCRISSASIRWRASAHVLDAQRLRRTGQGAGQIPAGRGAAAVVWCSGRSAEISLALGGEAIATAIAGATR